MTKEFIEKIEYFNSDKILELHCIEDGDYYENIYRNGFDKKKEYISPNFYVSCSPFIEIFSYYNKDSGLTICEFWDWDRRIFIFVAENEKIKLYILKEFLEIAKSMCLVEKTLKELHEDSDRKS